MLIGVSTEDEHNFRADYEFPPKESVLYEVVLPKRVEEAINIMRDKFEVENIPPLAFQTFAGHRNDYGLIFRNNYHEDVDLNPNDCSSKIRTKNLVGRVSFGMNYKEELREKGIFCKDTSKLNRLHINLFGSRRFLPKNFEVIQDSDEEHFNYLSEQIHFSLRWIEGKFDNAWNDLSEWERNKESLYLHRPCFDEMRSTYFFSNEETEHLNGTFIRKKSKTSDQQRGVIDFIEVHKKLGTKSRILKKNLTQEEVMKNFSRLFKLEDLKKVCPSLIGNRTEFEIVGYEPVLEILSQFGNVSIKDAQKIPYMDMIKGTDYLFNKVFPAIKNYVDSN
jgi:hypothetical protein